MHKTTFQLETEIAALTAERAKLMQDVDTALNLQAHAQRAEAEALERVAELEAALAARATPAQPDADEQRAMRIGKHVLEFATRGGWKDDGEGAFEFIQRHSYAVGFEDAGGKIDQFGTHPVNRWPIAAITAGLQPSPSSVGAAIPEGWKLVPVEPTDEMLHDGKLCAAFDAFDHPDTGMEIEVVNMADVWRDMLAAAPSIAQDGQKSEGA